MSRQAQGRHRAQRSTAARTSALLALTLAAVLGIALGVPAAGSYALWNSTASVSAGSIQSGSLTAAASVSPSLDVAYSSSTGSTTGGLTVTNRGTAAAAYSIAVTLRSGSDAALAKAITVVVWKTASAANCGTPVSPVTGTWAVFPAVTGTLGAGAAQSYCVRTSLGTVTGIASGSAVRPTITTSLKIGGWTSAASVDVAQSFTDNASPSAPSGLSASSTTTTSTRLTWNASSDNVGVKDYLIYRGTTLVGTVAASSTTFTNTGLASGTSYSYTVKARDAAGNVSAASGALVVKTVTALSCESTTWMATYRWATPAGDPATLKYALYINGISVPNGADGWNSYVQVPGYATAFLDTLPAGPATVEVRQILANGSQTSIGVGTVVLGQANYRTYLCG